MVRTIFITVTAVQERCEGRSTALLSAALREAVTLLITDFHSTGTGRVLRLIDGFCRYRVAGHPLNLSPRSRSAPHV